MLSQFLLNLAAGRLIVLSYVMFDEKILLPPKVLLAFQFCEGSLWVQCLESFL